MTGSLTEQLGEVIVSVSLGLGIVFSVMHGTYLFLVHEPVQVPDGGHVGPDDPLCRLDCPLQSIPVLFKGRSKPQTVIEVQRTVHYHLYSFEGVKLQVVLLKPVG